MFIFSQDSFCLYFSRYGGNQVLLASEWASRSSKLTLWRQFSAVPRCPGTEGLHHRHLLWYFRFGGSHCDQLLACLHCKLFSSPQQRLQRRSRGREPIMMMIEWWPKKMTFKMNCFVFQKGWTYTRQMQQTEFDLFYCGLISHLKGLHVLCRQWTIICIKTLILIKSFY